ncbi:Aste57867_9266 [Aphanomyces stellatus]|uniref:Aste57867_9266 protein n=1 Tax=Aphanomyces stellatus TaxID=120398 RepID=A0A485KML3_9STRA|nr:hypothetical protein As57867_009230 [Aphanomyces stellatus]VFT86149.1 Aste57867_9266 [Aphanomyces stellatus]
MNAAPSSMDVHTFKYIDVMVSAVDSSHRGHLQYVVQVTERGKGHYVVPRRYSAFRALYESVRMLQDDRSGGEKHTPPTRLNTNAVAQWCAICADAFPAKTSISLLCLGESPRSPDVVHTRMAFFHRFLVGVTSILRMFNWRENGHIYNAISRDQALALGAKVQSFLAIPAHFGTAYDYLHRDSLCRRVDATYCVRYPVVQENWGSHEEGTETPLPLHRRNSSLMSAKSHSALATDIPAARTDRAASVTTKPSHAALRRRIHVDQRQRDRLGRGTAAAAAWGGPSNPLPPSSRRKEMYDEEVVVLGEETEYYQQQMPRRRSTGALVRGVKV